MKEDGEWIKQIVCDNLRNKSVVIWGSGAVLDAFCLKNCHKMDIKGIVYEGNWEGETYPWNGKDVPVFRSNDYIVDRDDYIVICDQFFSCIEHHLQGLGVNPIEGYIHHQVADFFMEKKKLLIIAGNCQMMTIAAFLRDVPDIKQKYYTVRFPTHFWDNKWALTSLCLLVRYCDVYICTKHKDNDNHFFLRKELPSKCKIITVPNALLRLYWPQMKTNRVKARNSCFEYIHVGNQHGPFDYSDKNIDAMIADGKSVTDIIAELSREDFYTKEEILQHFEMQLRMLEYEEESCDVIISDYIKKQLGCQMLYRDMTHMQVCLVKQMVLRIISCLSESCDKQVEELFVRGNPIFDEFDAHCSEVPVYPCVSQHMNLLWCDNDTKYDVRFFNGMKKLTFFEYVEAYYDICKNMKAIQEKW